MPTTPYHETVRACIATAVRAQLDDEDIDLDVVEYDEIRTGWQNRPGVAVIYGADFNSGEGTNVRDAISYPCLVALLSSRAVAGEELGSLSVPLFRQIVHDACHNRRLSGLDTSALPAHVDPQPPIVDASLPGLEEIRTSCLVTVTALRPRGS